jgi:uncharacterized damage-inducible protein DinB
MEGHMNHLQRLVKYTNWANQLWLEFVLEKAPTDEYLTRMMSHILLAENIWFQRIYGEELDSEVFRTREKDELLGLAERNPRRYAEILTSDLERIVAYRKLNGEAMESRVSDILMHLVTHGNHHRGQMATYASKEKLGAPTTDYINYTRQL